MAFSEVKLFQVRPDRIQEFEELVSEMRRAQQDRAGCQSIRYVKRFYIFDQIANPPRLITKIVKCVKYYSYWEFGTIEEYHEAVKWFFAEYEKRIAKLTIMPFDINCGEMLE